MPNGTTPGVGTAAASPPTSRAVRNRFAWPGAKPALCALGFLCVGLGMIGVVVPGMPTTIFLIIALWAFSKSSDRFHAWLYHHRRFGPPLRAWDEHRVIPVAAKFAAISVMAASWLIVTFAIAESWVLPSVLGAVLLGVGTFIVTRPSVPPA